MLKSFVREIMGTAPHKLPAPRCLRQFAGKKRVLLVFADAEDDRASRQDDLLRKAHMRFIEEGIEVFNVAGGGVFPLFDDPHDLDADELREDLDGPQPGEFGLILIDRDGKVKLRASEPMRPEEIIGALATMPH
ncbi:DUF4174 domain-containing protein [Rhizobium sp. BE258]|uniref:DUF4174 domain-containing protein n=1 Tax=Rhizobium sp. BE258 TaxID=2817722 RepID=UPI0028553974|nr:DUF4174 domain-containing protein [Rhizobium sp. BE258]MDR7144453.1 hypothetical protein [Rhizobium sp. BE258]